MTDGTGGGDEVPALLSGTALSVFRLNGQFLAVSERLSRPAGLTAARWQVLGAVLEEPLPVAGIARAMGITRQSVQRVADLLVDAGLAVYLPNPAHRRAKLLAPTEAGLTAVRAIVPGHREFAGQLAEQLGGAAGLAEVREALRRLTEALDALEPGAADTPGT
ncbi:MarR family winged helix-turn-helix transcriptional regulator [Streptomyces sp. NEAU-Y11]|uniref:MarR family winged helix-turn-helix transcriptional regulator n=1 Tax=Streptomyces cucumeris TaxID=2962890 RepID=UPI0020C8F124|nr:MarR family winged helix-turn-helix transcriptional regulator [Streptomyces sp. NEAU-Y11]MCP9209224.1 MarR family winged helix-turn-helix transcriptional regulator [Streptomyces sp. NEAU-Y11]